MLLVWLARCWIPLILFLSPVTDILTDISSLDPCLDVTLVSLGVKLLKGLQLGHKSLFNTISRPNTTHDILSQVPAKLSNFIQHLTSCGHSIKLDKSELIGISTRVIFTWHILKLFWLEMKCLIERFTLHSLKYEWILFYMLLGQGSDRNIREVLIQIVFNIICASPIRKS